MLLEDVGTRVPFLHDDPFFLTTPRRIDADVEALAGRLGGLTVSFVPVKPAPDAETGFCHRNVAEYVELHGGRHAFGYALWVNRFLIMGEFHSVWLSPTGELVDPTPAAESEQRICFAWDQSLPAHYDYSDRLPNRAMSIVGKADPAAVAKAIDGLSPARLTYERRRADRAGLDVETYLAGKVGRTALSVAVEELIAACEKRDRLVVPTTTRVLSHDPKAFMAAQSKVSEVESRIRRLLAKEPREEGKRETARNGFSTSLETSDPAQPEVRPGASRELVALSGGVIIDEGDVDPGDTTGMLAFARLHKALENPPSDVIVIHLKGFEPTTLLDRTPHAPFVASSSETLPEDDRPTIDPARQESSSGAFSATRNETAAIGDTTQPQKSLGRTARRKEPKATAASGKTAAS